MEGRESTEIKAKRFLDISFLTVTIAFLKKIISYIPQNRKISRRVKDVFILVL